MRIHIERFDRQSRKSKKESHFQKCLSVFQIPVYVKRLINVKSLLNGLHRYRPSGVRQHKTLIILTAIVMKIILGISYVQHIFCGMTQYKGYAT